MAERQRLRQLRDEILRLAAEYTAVEQRQKKAYQPGDRIAYASRVYDERERVNLIDSALTFWLTAGEYAERFEDGFASFLGVRHCALVNSGSSANLLALGALTSPLLGERRLLAGDEVITVAAGFPTTVAPIVHYGLIPVFIDVTIPSYNADTAALREALSPKTRAVMLAHTLGNPFDLAFVQAFCKEHGLWLIEDNCDALGSEYLIDGKTRKTGTIGDLGTSSFYPPHHMTMGEGGAVYTDNATLHRIVCSLRDWGRDCVCPPGTDNRCGHRFDAQYGELPFGYDHKYVYSHLGYNLKVTDMQAAVGLAQLEKLPDFIDRRRHNHAVLMEGLADLSDYLILPEATQNSRPSWFGFLLTLREGYDAAALIEHLEAAGIQTRRLFAGNLLRHPCFDSVKAQEASLYRVVGSLEQTDRVMRDSFWVGVYPGLTDGMLRYMIAAFHDFFATQG
ncbi:MAG: lipopolysaccharide biosynthesis protein RfbH [Coriobacteriales bacterium]|jgi:CDP-6-deoxy-D-xylo-4-hexulose-3-dehydrase|nr:lipopolysaccharide biosynthesis protein RfbH [Coriobacteriales bacterium]